MFYSHIFCLQQCIHVDNYEHFTRKYCVYNGVYISTNTNIAAIGMSLNPIDLSGRDFIPVAELTKMEHVM